MRCLTLANALRDRGADCTFVCRPHEGHLIATIRKHAFEVRALPQLTTQPEAIHRHNPVGQYDQWLGTDWQTDVCQTHSMLGNSISLLVIDHYALDIRWESCFRGSAQQIMVIDDLANRQHDCDLLLDQNLGSQKTNYLSLTPTGAQLMVGEQYAMVRNEFIEKRNYSLTRRRSSTPRKILVSLGGVDSDNITLKVLKTLDQCSFSSPIDVTVVLGPTAPWREEVTFKAENAKHPTHVLSSVDNMADVMADADIAIGAAGSSSWERCTLGLPTLMVVLADNQRVVADQLSSAGAAWLLNLTDNFSEDVNRVMNTLLTDFDVRSSMIEKASTVCDGSGIERVVDTIFRRKNEQVS